MAEQAPTQLKFELKSTFAQFLWEPEKTLEDSKRTPDGSYTIGVLYSLERSMRSKNANAAALAGALHSKIMEDLNDLQTKLTVSRDLLQKELSDDVLQLPEYANPKDINVESDRVRPSIVKFIRCFVIYDQALHALNEQLRHQMIDKSKLLKTTHKVSTPLRRFMAETSKVIRLYHQQRKLLVAQAKPSASAEEPLEHVAVG